MTMFTSVRSVLRHYADFNGVAGRPEFWWFALFSAVAHLALNSLNLVTPEGTIYLGASLSGAFGIAVLIPTFAVAVRRFRDSGSSPLNLLWLLLPVAGGIVLIVLLAQPTRAAVAAASVAGTPATTQADPAEVRS